MESFLTQHATRKQTVTAGITALLILLVFAIAVPRATMTLPAVGPFMPMCALTVFTTAGIATFLLTAQFTATRQPLLGALGGAYAFTALAVAVQLLTFPGVFTPTGLLGAGPHSSAWMWVFWHGGFPFFIILAAFTRYRLEQAPIGAARVGFWAWLLIGGPTVVGAALCVLAIYGNLPPALKPATGISPFPNDTTAWVTWSLNIAAIIIVLLTGRLRSVLDQWLLIAVLACFVDTTLNFVSMARFSVGWYVARIFSMFAPGVVVCMLIWEVNLLYRRLFDAHTSLLRISVSDGLTGIYNRAYFDAQYHKEFERARRTHALLSLILIDIDHFKQYNDAFGHLRGDACLVAVASALARVVRRPADFVARYGGEEFVIVLPDTDLRGASEIAEQAREAVMQLSLETPALIGYVTISAGCAVIGPDSLLAPDDLVRTADAALYRAKSEGRNQVQLAVDR
ncbi:GGDEF domain-containing protein (plasmid) [Cupriavidus pinatubonensis]|uniref:GGDEF domain-containing protein n=1 Tax=Cupriavidus pinatubonensis TaxID=248026 RepID=UPI001C734CBC|nr:sensor domain-containing diguanylate cyclase [Cupriavidus pinatubonensis]QYY34171.1 GGDEF domain-containing protein [Cupriavidus pinatubonensis]